MELHERVVGIHSRDDLAAFISELQADLIAKPDKWENSSLEKFLEALAAWCSDMDGYLQNHGDQAPAQPSWRLLGEMLLAAKMYE